MLLAYLIGVVLLIMSLFYYIKKLKYWWTLGLGINIVFFTFIFHSSILLNNISILKKLEKEKEEILYLQRLKSYLIDKSIFKNINPRIMEYNVELLTLKEDNKNILDICTPNEVDTIKLLKYE